MNVIKNKYITKYDLTDEKKTYSKTKIYHYTTPNGLKEIIENNTLRFTDCQFLNDKSEYIHIRNILSKVVDSYKNISQLPYNEINDAIKLIIETTNDYEQEDLTHRNIDGRICLKLSKRRYFIFCTSRREDSLNMWNYYLKDGKYQGYNIGFTVNQLVQCLSDNKNDGIKVFSGNVIYDEKNKEKLLNEMIVNAVIESKDSIEEKNYNDYDYQEKFRENLTNNLWRNIEKIRLFLKDNAFADENEFRIVIRLNDEYSFTEGDIVKVGYTVKNGIFIPYCDLTIDKKETINCINLSPVIDGVLAKKGIERFLKYHNYSNKIEIMQSKIPVRY